MAGKMFGWEGGKSLGNGAGQIIPSGGTPTGRMGREVMEMAVVFYLLEDGGMMQLLVQTNIYSSVKGKKH